MAEGPVPLLFLWKCGGSVDSKFDDMMGVGWTDWCWKVSGGRRKLYTRLWTKLENVTSEQSFTFLLLLYIQQ